MMRVLDPFKQRVEVFEVEGHNSSIVLKFGVSGREASALAGEIASRINNYENGMLYDGEVFESQGALWGMVDDDVKTKLICPVKW